MLSVEHADEETTIRISGDTSQQRSSMVWESVSSGNVPESLILAFAPRRGWWNTEATMPLCGAEFWPMLVFWISPPKRQPETHKTCRQHQGEPCFSGLMSHGIPVRWILLSWFFFFSWGKAACHCRKTALHPNTHLRVGWKEAPASQQSRALRTTGWVVYFSAWSPRMSWRTLSASVSAT